MASNTTLSSSAIQGIADVLSVMTNREIDQVLAEAGIDDPNPQPSHPGVYRAISKRDCLFQALAARQQRDRSANAVLRFIEVSMQPVRFAGNHEGFESARSDLNERLLHSGLELNESGKIAAVTASTTVSEARDRTRRFRGKLESRQVHPRVLGACHNVIRDENYFHTVLEAAKSLAEEIRQKSGLSLDGGALVKAAFEYPREGFPVVAFNKLETQTQRSEHRGLTHLCHGIFGAFRNPTAHEPSGVWEVSEQEALDVCSVISLLHSRLDQAVVVPEELRN